MVQIVKRMVGLVARFRLNRKRRRAGVTLLEILVAIGVLAFAISAVMQIFPMGFSSSAKASYTAIAYELAGRKMDEIRSTNIFGGDANPNLNVNDPETFKYFGHRTHPLSSIIGPGADDTTAEEFVAFSSADGYNVESKYFYRVDLVPQVDIGQKSGNYVYSSGGESEASNGTVVRGYRYGFCDAYRVKVTVRGPVKKKEYAQDEAWANYKKGAIEASLATIITNKEFGIAYLAYDLPCRYVIKDGTAEGYTEHKWYDGYHQDSRSIYVCGPNGKRFYPENFAVIRPEHLSYNERFDTGPAIAFPIKPNNNDVNARQEAYYASRVGGYGAHNYSYYQGFNFSTASKYTTPNEIKSARILFKEYKNGYSPSGSSLREPPNKSWNDPDGWEDFKVNPSDRYPNSHSGIVSSFTPGGLNLSNQDNIMLMCKVGSQRGMYAESNKLIFMAPPQSSAEVVNQYGTAYKTHNRTPYWRFDLLNQVYGRDSDIPDRETIYKSSPLADRYWGDVDSERPGVNSTTFYDEIGDLDLKSYKGDGTVTRATSITAGCSAIEGMSRRPEFDRASRRADTDTIGTLINSYNINNGTCTLQTSNSDIVRVYGYPKATFNSDGTIKSGTVVRFLMKMYQQ